MQSQNGISTGKEVVGRKDEGFAERSVLSESWRLLFDMGVPVLSNDPWAVLAQTQGIQVVDLQQVQAHKEPLDEREVEQALNMMQEVPARETK